MIELIFVVNGEEVPVVVSPERSLRIAVRIALKKSQNTGRLLKQWELRYDNGVAITKLQHPVSAYGFQPGHVLYLSLRVGAGGCFSCFQLNEALT